MSISGSGSVWCFARMVARAAVVATATSQLVLAQSPPQLSAAPPACIGCQVDVERIRQAYSEADWKQLRRGEVLLSQSDHARSADEVDGAVEATALMPEPAVRVWDVVTDFESRPKYVPTMKEVRIVRVADNRVWLNEHLQFFWTDIRFQNVNTLEPEQGTVTWALDPEAPHDIADSTGSWQLVPLSERETLVRYRARVDTGRAVPSFIETFITKRSLPKLLESVRDEVRRRALR